MTMEGDAKLKDDKAPAFVGEAGAFFFAAHAAHNIKWSVDIEWSVATLARVPFPLLTSDG